MGWSGEEAWIFLSIGDAGPEPATLDKVISRADSMNHAIPTVEEFEGAIGQLLGAGLVAVSENKYELTRSGRSLYKDINAIQRGHIDRFIETAKQWRRNAPTKADPVPWIVDPEGFRQAVEQYGRWFWATYEKLQGRSVTGDDKGDS